MVGQARRFVAVVGLRQETAAAAVPDGLVDLAEIRAMRAHAGVQIPRLRREEYNVDHDQAGQEPKPGIGQGRGGVLAGVPVGGGQGV